MLGERSKAFLEQILAKPVFKTPLTPSRVLTLQTPASLQSADLRIQSGGKVGLLEAENQPEYRFWYRQKADVLNSLQIPAISCGSRGSSGRTLSLLGEDSV